MDKFTQVERLNKLADIIEEYPDNFDMEWWVTTPERDSDHPRHARGARYSNRMLNYPSVVVEEAIDVRECGTRACLAGWAVSLWGSDLAEQDLELGFEVCGAKLLGIDKVTAAWLFDAEAKHQSAEDAAAILRLLAEED